MKINHCYAISNDEFVGLKGTPQYVQMLRQCFTVEEVSLDEVNDIRHWLFDNCTDLFCLIDGIHDEALSANYWDIVAIFLLSEKDAINFKLRWVS